MGRRAIWFKVEVKLLRDESPRPAWRKMYDPNHVKLGDIFRISKSYHEFGGFDEALAAATADPESKWVLLNGESEIVLTEETRPFLESFGHTIPTTTGETDDRQFIREGDKTPHSRTNRGDRLMESYWISKLREWAREYDIEGADGEDDNKVDQSAFYSLSLIVERLLKGAENEYDSHIEEFGREITSLSGEYNKLRSTNKRLLAAIDKYEWTCYDKQEVEPGLWRDCGTCSDCKLRGLIRELQQFDDTTSKDHRIEFHITDQLRGDDTEDSS